ncbi:MAG: hypothetical protein HY331_03055 [Chloroflexi bacterium]|nr:hypothetical protein [Chloroflexota bacterium]
MEVKEDRQSSLGSEEDERPARWVEPVRLPDLFLSSSLRYRWGAESQQLYFWLRGHVCRGEPSAPAEALAWHRRGFLATYATGDRLRAEAVPVSKNTLTNLIEELRSERVCIPMSGRRGYVFLLGEWLCRPSLLDEVGAHLYFEAFYLEARLSQDE